MLGPFSGFTAVFVLLAYFTFWHAKAQVNNYIHQKCLKATDYAGCVSANDSPNHPKSDAALSPSTNDFVNPLTEALQGPSVPSGRSITDILNPNHDGCPLGTSRRKTSGLLGIGAKDYGCLTDYEYANVKEQENAGQRQSLQNSLMLMQLNKPVYCYGSGSAYGIGGLVYGTSTKTCF
jgi:hypothetical protein